MTNGARKDPYMGYQFRVDIGSVTDIGFREVTGLSFEAPPVEYRNGNEKHLHVRKIVGSLRTFQNISCKRGIIQDRQLYLYYLEALNGNPTRLDGSITLLGQDGEESGWRWAFYEAFIGKWEGPTFNATANEIGVETIDIVPERVEAQ